MTKNIIVTDENGNVIGRTYPKRAQGLVKNGRAEYVSDCMIRLISAHAPIEEIKTDLALNADALQLVSEKGLFEDIRELN